MRAYLCTSKASKLSTWSLWRCASKHRRESAKRSVLRARASGPSSGKQFFFFNSSLVVRSRVNLSTSCLLNKFDPQFDSRNACRY